MLSLLLLGMVISCSGSSDDDVIEPLNVIPANLSLEVSVIGADGSNLYGDGSGVVNFTATATNAVKYGFKFDSGEEIESFSGNIEHTYTVEGSKEYLVTIFAYSSTNHSISKFQTITVYVEETGPQLVWSDEFNTNGAPDLTKWGYNIGRGDNGWGNGEKQYYTDRSDNVIVEGGFLKITAKKENYEGAQYTSTRMLTQGKFNFTYGRVEVRAKLPSGGGTWPAIWMLGSNISTVSWPACGEIDIMEHWGHNPSEVSSATHTTACSGGCSDVGVGSTTLSDYATEFHVYAIEWSEDEIDFLIDGDFRYRYRPSEKNDDNWPYTKDQFLILNIAMGGSWFDIDPNFVQSTMEIDYVRVYQ